MTDEINNFDGKYLFLSNFYPVRLTYNGMTGPTLEHLYQASKAKHSAGAEAVLACETAAQAKQKGRRIVIRDDWTDETKLGVMLDLLRLKFESPGLRQQLMMTRDAWLVEGNTWGDRYWGFYRGQGMNMLGLLLMQVRHEIRSAQ